MEKEEEQKGLQGRQLRQWRRGDLPSPPHHHLSPSVAAACSLPQHPSLPLPPPPPAPPAAAAAAAAAAPASCPPPPCRGERKPPGSEVLARQSVRGCSDRGEEREEEEEDDDDDEEEEEVEE
ncbi:hypothetical protein EYF80_022002 [Liparis tanakae]|uniref:Uncharacterized protein n=1 Tax=Liparis tanakae TaxID=230148 RepID=A0A4Z2HPW0_9TELE|nr:hypothetical protein EYF80_022002 [Liparis tanakae]